MSTGQIGSRRVGGRTVIAGVTGEDVVCLLDRVGADAQWGELEGHSIHASSQIVSPFAINTKTESLDVSGEWIESYRGILESLVKRTWW